MNLGLFLRFAVPLMALLALLAVGLTPAADHLIGQWFQSDLRMHADLIHNVIRESLVEQIRKPAKGVMEDTFNRIARDERVLAMAWCDQSIKPKKSGTAWPPAFSCPVDAEALKSVKPFYRVEPFGGGNVLLSVFPLSVDGVRHGRLVILHDLSFVSSRSLSARLYLAGFLSLFAILAALITVVTTRFTLRRWIRSVRSSLQSPLGKYKASADPHLAPVLGEIRQLLRDLDISRRTAAGIRVDWSPETLQNVLKNELPGVDVIVVSNREPYIHNRSPGGDIVMQRPASGMVTALEPVMRACRGVWIAHGSGTADRDAVDEMDRIAVPPKAPIYTLRRVWLSEEEQEGYYYGLANEGLWPLCHITYVRPIFREPDWDQYVAVNRKFAEAVVEESRGPDPIVLVQDYHLALVPRMIRERLPEATIITFWHIPWPNSEVFSICPWREKIVDGLLGSSVIGFHTQLHCNNFIETADRFLECHIDREESIVSVGGHPCLVRPYPISIAWPPEPLKGLPSVSECRAAVLARHKLPETTLLAVGVERFDFTKGIPDRFRAVEILLEKNPEWIGRFVLLQIAAPSRSKLDTYRSIQAEAIALAEAINDRFGRDNYKPIILLIEHHEPEQIYEMFRAANICIVSSLHDGMNLVAKEFVAARDDEAGVLVLSSFAGASRELMEALIVNPYDAKATAQAIDRAMRMSPEQQRDRMRLMRESVSENNVYYWAGRMLLDASRLRKRQKIESNIASANRQGVHRA